MPQNLCLDLLEQRVHTGETGHALDQFIAILAHLRARHGELGDDFSASSMTGLTAAGQHERFLTRLAGAAGSLLANPGCIPTPLQYAALLGLHPWIGAIFAATALGNADHVARYLDGRGAQDATTPRQGPARSKRWLLYSNESDLALDLDALWVRNSALAAGLALALLSPEFQGSPAAHAKREALLAWLPGKLAQIDDLDALPTDILHNVYMYCSYADSPARHAIKKDVNVLVRRKLARLGLADLDPGSGRPSGRGRRKPLMIVVVEWFSGGHSIYRTHSRAIEAARQHFEVVGFGFGYAVDAAGRAIFDRFIELEEPDYIGECLGTIREFAKAHEAQVLYMPSVGMFVLTVFLSNLRVAPLQVAGLGHPATTHSAQIDYVSVEEDYVGDPACFSETLLTLPVDGQPYRPSAALPEIVPRVPARRGVVKIIVTASAMKINPRFLEACARIQKRAGVPVQFHFMTGTRNGLQHAHMRTVIARVLPGAHVHGFHDYPAYLARVNDADMFISPFPFGNTNGIVDALTVGLPGVCKTGPEVFEHIDGAMFTRAGMPSWTIAGTVDAYIEAAARLATDHGERETLRQRLIDGKAVERFFAGNAAQFGERLARCVRSARHRHPANAQPAMPAVL
ncbi:glycosyl transferase family 1 [Paraburkholderia gardini]|uniref:glycosyl transferase family 1 n=1 Tax=Paraburkholderia gardini TaxID=2823469 RepID=UPI001D3EA450|nr:glycosyl transferase family 1 [Paraburkholderia gardini]CAG4885570.1 UDP-glucose:protein N-beta-glucosyltransferase [Paraburkholderia gardini]